jgi:lipopolysaccharide transport system permease protein
MLWYGVSVSAHILLLPLFLLLAFITTSAVAVWFSALNVKYRDVKYVVPFIVRIGMYITPIGFMSSVVPEKWRLLYHCANPMVGVIDGFRWCLFGANFEPYWPGFFSGVAISFFLLISGAYFFRNTEKTFADVI